MRLRDVVRRRIFFSRARLCVSGAMARLRAALASLSGAPDIAGA
jgi:hypothetical protein